MSLIAERWKAERLKRRTDGVPMSQAKFASLLGISPSYYCLIESGQRTNPSRELIKKAAEVTRRTFKHMAGE